MSALVLAAVMAAAPVRVMELPWTLADVPPKLGLVLEDQLAQALRAQGLAVMTSQDVVTLLGLERQRQLMGCSSEASECAAELGGALGCAGVLSVTLAKVGGGYRGLAKVLSSTRPAVLAEAPITASDDEALVEALKAVAVTLAAPFKPAGDSHLGTWLAAGGSVLFTGAAVAGFALAGTRHSQLYTATSYSQASRIAAEGRTFQLGAWISAGLAVSALVTTLVLLAVGPTEVTPTVSIAPGSATLGLAWELR